MEIDRLFAMRDAIWATRDGCPDHYPRYCPPECANAGKHDADLPAGLCECHQCRKPSRIIEACGPYEAPEHFG